MMDGGGGGLPRTYCSTGGGCQTLVEMLKKNGCQRLGPSAGGGKESPD
jgi:hypothetical protein